LSHVANKEMEDVIRRLKDEKATSKESHCERLETRQ